MIKECIVVDAIYVLILEESMTQIVRVFFARSC